MRVDPVPDDETIDDVGRHRSVVDPQCRVAAAGEIDVAAARRAADADFQRAGVDRGTAGISIRAVQYHGAGVHPVDRHTTAAGIGVRAAGAALIGDDIADGQRLAADPVELDLTVALDESPLPKPEPEPPLPKPTPPKADPP